jgi:hypothetical protein
VSDAPAPPHAPELGSFTIVRNQSRALGPLRLRDAGLAERKAAAAAAAAVSRVERCAVHARLPEIGREHLMGYGPVEDEQARRHGPEVALRAPVSAADGATTALRNRLSVGAAVELPEDEPADSPREHAHGDAEELSLRNVRARALMCRKHARTQARAVAAVP